jgi:glycosyltransferase involved in cell wall biosynthesis
MKYGAVVAGLDAPGIRDLVIDGQTGIVALTVAELTTKIQLLLSQPKRLEAIGRQAYLFAKENFSETNRENLLRELLGSYD